MDKNKDGVVTIDEFIESCQKVSNDSKGTIPFASLTAELGPWPASHHELSKV